MGELLPMILEEGESLAAGEAGAGESALSSKGEPGTASNPYSLDDAPQRGRGVPTPPESHVNQLMNKSQLQLALNQASAPKNLQLRGSGGGQLANSANGGGGGNNFGGAGGGSSGGGGSVGPVSNQLDEIIHVLREIWSLQLTLIESVRGSAPSSGAGASSSPKSEIAGKDRPSWAERQIDTTSSRSAEILSNRFRPTIAKTVKQGGQAIGGAIGGAVGGPAGAFVGTAVGAIAGQFIEAMSNVIDAINSRAAELAKYSGELSVTQAQNNVKIMMADFREAQTLGPDMARVQNMSTDIWIEIRDAVLPIKKWLLGFIADFLEWVKEQIKQQVDLGYKIYTYIENLPEIIAAAIHPLGDISETIDNIDRQIARERADRNKNKQDDNGPLAQFIQNLKNDPILPAPINHMIPRPHAPIFGL